MCNNLFPLGLFVITVTRSLLILFLMKFKCIALASITGSLVCERSLICKVADAAFLVMDKLMVFLAGFTAIAISFEVPMNDPPVSDGLFAIRQNLCSPT